MRNEEPENVRQERAQRNRRKITAFAEKSGFTESLAEINQKKLLVLAKAGINVDPVILEKFAKAPLVEYQLRPYCAHTSQAALESGLASGALLANLKFPSIDKDNPPILRGYHVLNFKMMKDGSYVLFDLTAGPHLDWDQGNYDILAIHFRSKAEMMEYMTLIYQGDWEEYDLAQLRTFIGDMEQKDSAFG